MTSKCPICKGTGLLPFTKENKVIQNAFIYCQCHDEPEHYHQPDPSDFDFACSSAFRGYSLERCGMPDPAYRLPEPEPPKEQVVVHRHSSLSQQEYGMLQQASLKADYLGRVLKEHLTKKGISKKYTI